jgi:hypothetical protein
VQNKGPEYGFSWQCQREHIGRITAIVPKNGRLRKYPFGIWSPRATSLIERASSLEAVSSSMISFFSTISLSFSGFM